MRITVELKQATVEAAGVLKDLVATIKRARAEVDTYAVEQLAVRLKNLADQSAEMLKAENEQFIEAWAASKKQACDEANEHLRSDWRLAVAVNAVGRTVWDALQDTATYPDAWEDQGDIIPNHISEAFITGKTAPNWPG